MWDPPTWPCWGHTSHMLLAAKDWTQKGLLEGRLSPTGLAGTPNCSVRPSFLSCPLHRTQNYNRDRRRSPPSPGPSHLSLADISFHIFLAHLTLSCCLPLRWPKLTQRLFFSFFLSFWLLWVFAAARALSLVVASRATLIAVHRLLMALASLVTELKLPGAQGFTSCGSRAWEHRLSSCGPRDYLLHSMWHLPRAEIKPRSPEGAGRFLSTVPPGSPTEALLISTSRVKDYTK